MTSHLSRHRTVRLLAPMALLLAAACGKGDGGTAPPKPAAIASGSSATPTATVGTALTTAPTFTVTDASGSALGNISVTVTVASGGGSLVGAPTRTSAGATSVGAWTLGTTAGTNTLSIAVSGLTPLIISATGTPGAAAKVVVSAGNAQTALAGAQLATPLAAAVQDQYNNGIPNVPVTFQTLVGGGTVSPGSATTNAAGIASGAVWRLGNKGGTQTATASASGFFATFGATIQSTFPLDLRFYGTAMSADAQTAFTNAANRLKAAIVAQLTPVELKNANMATDCDGGGPSVTLNEITSGVIIYATVANIDGAGKVLAQAGPCFVRGSNSLPAAGYMKFDEADIQNYITSGRFESVVLHEMAHVVGFGTVWGEKGFLTAPAFTWNSVTQTWDATGSTNPRYIGGQGLSACIAAGGSANACASGVGVAVEATGGAGTADGHWRESVFDNELMTGYAEGTPNMPWGAMSIAQFQDLGFTVNLGAADPYNVPNLLAMARMSARQESGDQPGEVVVRPRFAIDGSGRIQPIKRGYSR